MNVGWVRRWKLNLAPEHFRSCRSYRQIIEVLYGERARQEGKPRWGDQTPHYVTDIRVLFAIFPDAKFWKGHHWFLYWASRLLNARKRHLVATFIEFKWAEIRSRLTNNIAR